LFFDNLECGTLGLAKSFLKHLMPTFFWTIFGLEIFAKHSYCSYKMTEKPQLSICLKAHGNKQLLALVDLESQCGQHSTDR